MKLVHWLTIAALVVAVRPVQAEPVRIQLFVPEGENPTTAVVTASPVLSRPADAPIDNVVAKSKVPGVATMDLRPDVTWRLTAEAEGLWSPELLLAPGLEPREASLRLVPTCRLVAHLEGPEGQRLSGSLSVRLRTPTNDPAIQDADQLVLECPVEEGPWRCEVPSGTFDVRLRAPGYLSHFYWKLTLPPRQDFDFGALRLQPGSSIVGWLVTEDGSQLGAGTKVVATPRSAGAGDPRAEVKHRSLTVDAQVDDRGFFHLRGLSLGAYVLAAEQKGFVPLHSLPVMVGEASETELREPLVLTRPAQLRVYLDPPVDSHGEAWKLQLLNGNELEYSGPASASGTWTAPSLAPKPYMLMVTDSEGSRVTHERIEVEGPMMEHWLTLDLVEVEGLLTLGGEPLPGQLAFGGTSGVTSIKMQADEEGRFSGQLPKAGNWPVDVRSESPEVFRRLRAVEIEPSPGTRRARIEIELPATRLEGEVVDSDGGAIDGTTVLAVPVPRQAGDPAERPSYTRTRPGGEFAFEGLAPAAYRLQALMVDPAGGELQSEPVEVDLLKEDPLQSVRLVIGPYLEFRGRLVAGSAGIPGADIWIIPIGTGDGVFVPSARSGPDGRFDIRLPEGTETVEVTVFAPGFVLYKEILAVAEGQETLILVEQQGGGTLRIRPRDPIDLSMGRGLPSVVRADGIRFDLGTLSRWTLLNQGASFSEWAEIPKMPAGGYTVCWPRSAETFKHDNESPCEDGYLPAYGRLEIIQQVAEEAIETPESSPGFPSNGSGKE